MNKDIIAGNWKQLTGAIRKRWGKLTDDHLAQVDGDRRKLAGIIQENYGLLADEAEEQITDWEISRKKMTQQTDDALQKDAK